MDGGTNGAALVQPDLSPCFRKDSEKWKRFDACFCGTPLWDSVCRYRDNSSAEVCRAAFLING
jgi:hypothetical protein